MSVAGIVAVVVTAVLVLTLAFYLIWVVVILRRLVDVLGKVTFGVGAIAHRVAPIGPVVDDINGNLGAVADALEGLVVELQDEAPSRAS